MENVIDVKAVVSKQLFYNQNSMFGVYSFQPVYSSSEIKVNKEYGNFVVNGNCPQLIEGKEYEFIIKTTKHKKYGDGYSFVEVKERKLTTIEEQQEYLRQVISKRDADTLIHTYPNEMIVDFIKAGKVDISKTVGIKDGKLNKIVKKLCTYENLQLALIELKDLGITMTAMQKLVDYFGSQETLIEKIKENIYVLTEVDMFSFVKVDDYAMKRGDSPESVYRIRACFEHIVKDNGKDGHSWIDVSSLIHKAEELLNIDTEKIVNEINSLKEKQSKFYINDNKFTLKKYFMHEFEVKSNLDRLLNEYKPSDINVTIEEIENKFNITYTNEQKEAIQKAFNSGVFVLNGKAGTGKTTVLQGILEYIETDNYITCALSGKAAKVLASKGLRSSTIHRMLGVGGNGKFKYNKTDPLPYDVVIIDESSMVNSYLFYSVLQAIPDGGKIIIVGDNGQLASIGIGAIFDDLLNANVYPSVELTKVHRQAQKSGILTEANKVRDGLKINGRYDYDSKIYGELNDFVLFPKQSREHIFSNIIEISKGYFDKYGDEWFHDYQILTALKQRGENSVLNLNKELQGVFNDLSKDYIERGAYQYREKDKIIHSGNNYGAITIPSVDTYEKYKDCNFSQLIEDEDELVMEIGLESASVFNGTIGKIVHINFQKKEVLIEFEDVNGLVIYDQQQLSMIELAYAISIHRSQGMGVKNILATFDFVAYKLLSKHLVYTAMTRASEKLVIICENAALHKAIETDHGSTRNTFLKDLLLEVG